MNKNSVIYFSKPSSFLEFYNSLDIYGGWKMKKGLMNSRGKLIYDKVYTNLLRDKFTESGFFRKKVSVAEIVTWLDNLSLIHRLILQLRTKVDSTVIDQIAISMEYRIKLSKNMRVDFIIIYRNRYLLLEMRTSDSFDKIRSAWERKIHELIIYKELMSNYLNNRIIIYAFISLFEYDSNGKVIKHISYNDNQINYLCEYILEYLIY